MEEVWSEDGEGQSLSQSLLSVHHGRRMSCPQAGCDFDIYHVYT